VIARALEEDADAPGMTAAALLDRVDITPAVREAIRARVEVSTGAPAETVGADELTGVAGVSDEPSRGVAGGNQRLAHELATVLGHRVHLRSPVTAVTWSGDGATVRTGDTDIDAAAVVVAVPAPLVARIDFEPVLPASRRDALAALGYGHAAKLFVPLRSVPAPSAVLSVPERYWTWTARAGGDVQPVVHAFAGSRPALDRLAVAGGPERWLESLAALRPDLELDRSDALLSTWSDDPWARGAYSVHTPGGNDATLGEHCGALVFAGEYTAGPYAGLMEGALRSGIRAAAEIDVLAQSR
jgi:monoamine oxidase